MDESRTLLTTAQAAELLGIHPDTLRHYRRTVPHIPHYRIGGAYRYDRREVLEFFRSCKEIGQ